MTIELYGSNGSLETIEANLPIKAQTQVPDNGFKFTQYVFIMGGPRIITSRPLGRIEIGYTYCHECTEWVEYGHVCPAKI